MSYVPQVKATWTFEDIDRLREYLGDDWPRFADRVGLKYMYLTQHLRGGHQKPGRGAAEKLNALVEYVLEEEKKTRIAPATASAAGETSVDGVSENVDIGAIMRSIERHLEQLRIALAPKNSANLGPAIGGGYRYIIRRPFTQCPKCRFVEEKTFTFMSPAEARLAYDKAIAWAHEPQNGSLPGVD